jgi:hypothetical protein
VDVTGTNTEPAFSSKVRTHPNIALKVFFKDSFGVPEDRDDEWKEGATTTVRLLGAGISSCQKKPRDDSCSDYILCQSGYSYIRATAITQVLGNRAPSGIFGFYWFPEKTCPFYNRLHYDVSFRPYTQHVIKLYRMSYNVKALPGIDQFWRRFC